MRLARYLFTSVAFVVAAVPAVAQIYSDHYAVILKDSPVAGRFAGREAMQSAAAQNYRAQVASTQAAVRRQIESRNITAVESVDTVLNAIFVSTTPDRIAELRAMPEVLDVVRLPLMHPLLNRATQLMNAPAAWSALGGQGSAGQGMKIGILDSGIDQTHPAFQDQSLTPPSGFPKCTDGHPEDCAYTNNKVIVARSYARLLAPGPAATSRPDDFSPRDRVGHGSAVASVAAANAASGAVTITGMAPKAFLGNYKIFGSPFVNDVFPGSVVLKALDDATKDGMDVIQLSSGFPAMSGPLDTGAACGLAAGSPCDPVATGFENAAKAGAIIVVSAGNNGSDGVNYPVFGSISSPATAPDVIAVGSTGNSHFFDPAVSVTGGPSNLQKIAGALGDDTSAPVGAWTFPAVDVSKISSDTYGCSSFPAGSLNGVFAIIQRSVVGSATACSFATKVDNAVNAGANGVILYMSDSSTLVAPGNLDTNFVPVIMISLADGNNLKSYVNSNPAAPVIIDPSAIEQDDTADANQLASFSSFGPNPGDLSIKPDLVATGGDFNFLWVYMAAQNYDPLGDLFSSNRYASAAGTSFASPMVAGAAALVKQKHPTWTAAQIKSALVNTSAQNTTMDDSGNNVDVEWMGAGRLDAGAAIGATVLVSPVSVSFGALSAAPSGLSKQLTVTNVGSSSVTLTVAVVPGAASATGNLSPATNPALDKTSLTLAPNASGTVTLTLSGTLPQAGTYTGAVTLKATGVSLTVPYMYLVSGGAATGYVLTCVCNQGNAFFEGIVGQQPFDPLNTLRPASLGVIVTDAAGLPVANVPVTWSARPRTAVTFQNTASATNQYGIALTDVTIAQTGNITVTASAAGQTWEFDGFGRTQPTISSGGVVDNNLGSSPIAPGSYISIYGAGLADTGVIDTASAAFSPITPNGYALPLNLDGVTVSFDTANGSYAGHITFVSPTQVNVQAPWELQGQSSAQVKVTIDSYSYGNVVTVPVADTVPSFFQNGGIVAARDQNFAAISAGNPVKRGAVVQLYLNGLGPVSNQPNSGEPASGDPSHLATTNAAPTVTIGGQQAQVSFSGLAPGFPGLYQINATVPSGISAGTAQITVSIGGKTTQTSGLPVN
ncbi:MAG TPA: S8 family serine peptidase [Candidatus Acidoferrales bacterium]|nr:S8 family serine peptidase [Candidatus Acidoferrales bacterium]